MQTIASVSSISYMKVDDVHKTIRVRVSLRPETQDMALDLNLDRHLKVPDSLMSNREHLKFTIVTPSSRQNLLAKCIEQVNNQTYQNWQHLVALDRLDMSWQLDDARRQVVPCKEEHRDYGNTCRAGLYDYATGDWILYLDDDDLMFPECLETIATEIAYNPRLHWGYFRIKRREESDLFSYPPRYGKITAQQIFHKRIIKGKQIRWFVPDERRLDQIADYATMHLNLEEYNPILIDKALGNIRGSLCADKIEEWRT